MRPSVFVAPGYFFDILLSIYLSSLCKVVSFLNLIAFIPFLPSVKNLCRFIRDLLLILTSLRKDFSEHLNNFIVFFYSLLTTKKMPFIYLFVLIPRMISLINRNIVFGLFLFFSPLSPKYQKCPEHNIVDTQEIFVE